jgi:hypothetical protein
MVIVDAPPMMHLADARLLGRQSDGVVLVVRAGHTMRDAALVSQPATHRRRHPHFGYGSQRLGSSQDSGPHLWIRVWLRIWLWVRPKHRSQTGPFIAPLTVKPMPANATIETVRFSGVRNSTMGQGLKFSHA